MRFDLTDQPWIPVRTVDGVLTEYSLRQLYGSAPSVRDLAIPFALEYVAMLRMLATILQSALPERAGRRTKARWLQNHAACAVAVDDYLQTWQPRFDLFDPERPFMQCVVSEEVGLTTVSALRADWASGNNAVLFDHHVDRVSDALSPGEAARALLATLLFQPGGGVSRPFNRTDSPGTKSLHAMADGPSLWELLVLNIPAVEQGDSSRPIWERDQDHVPDKTGTVPLGWLDRATWRSRAVQLILDPDGLVRCCRTHQHLKLPGGPPFDPYAPIDRPKGKEPAPLRASAGRALWRDAEALLRGLTDRQEGVVAEAAWILRDLDLASHGTRVVGQVTNQAKVVDVCDARMPVSASLLEDDERIGIVGALVDIAKKGAGAYRVAVKKYADELGVSDGWELAVAGETVIWSKLGNGFRSTLADVAAAEKTPTLSEPFALGWVELVVRVARQTYYDFGAQGAFNPARLKALATGRQVLRNALWAIESKELAA